MLYAEVILPLAIGTYHYIVPKSIEDSIQIGDRVSLHFGAKRIYTAIIRSLSNELPHGLDEKKLRIIDKKLDENAILNSNILSLMDWIAEYYSCPLGLVLDRVMPKELLPNSQTIIKLNEDVDISTELNETDVAILDILKYEKNKSAKIEQIQSKLNKNAFASFEKLLDLGLISSNENLISRYNAKTDTFVSLFEAYRSEDTLNSLLDKLKRAPRQSKIVLDFLKIALEKKDYSISVRAKELYKEDKNAYTALNILIKKNIFLSFKKEVSRIENNNLPEVNTIYNPEKVSQLKDGTTLLWSNSYIDRETEILNQIRLTLDSGKQVLFLSPSSYDLPSAQQFIAQIQATAGNYPVYFYHRFVSPLKRIELFKSISSKNNPFIVIGTRSAIFLPMPNIGLIVVDQEHEYMYKEQQKAPKYHTRDIAIMLSHIAKNKLLLTSETPSLESYFNAMRGKYNLLRNDEPKRSITDNININLIDLKKLRKQKAISYENVISPKLEDAINATISKGQKVMLIQNRRAYSSAMICRNCNEVINCPNCDVSLHYHKVNNTLRCHYCDFSAYVPAHCPNCNMDNITYHNENNNDLFNIYGYGSQRIEEELKEKFSNYKILRIDSDTLQSKSKIEEIHNNIESDDIDIIIATPVVRNQALWSNIGLLAIIQLETILGFPDFRSTEKAFQLFHSLISSAMNNRFDNEVRFIIQTNDVDSNFINMLRDYDYYQFLNKEMQERELFKFPPFYRLTKLTLRSKNESILRKVSFDLYQLLKQKLGNDIVGQDYSPSISRIDQFYIREILLRRKFNVSHKLERKIIDECIDIIRRGEFAKQVDISIEADPL